MLVMREMTEKIIGAAIEVHREIGAGMLESTYEMCMCAELSSRGLHWERQVAQPILYKGTRILDAYRIDVIVEASVILEIKAVEDLAPIHEAQLRTYLKHSKLKVGLLINFNVPVLTDGLKRIVM